MVQKTERSGREVLDAIETSLKKLTEQQATSNNGLALRSSLAHRNSDEGRGEVGALSVIPGRKRESDDTRELYKALHTAQRAFKGVEKSGFINGRNIPYAKINDLIDASRAALHANNLVVSTRQVVTGPGVATLVTRLYHFPSGQFIESELPLLNGTDEQKRGSSVTYAWRYTYAPLIGLVDTSYDDDAEATKR